MAFRLAHLKRQHQLQASGEGKPLNGANAVIPNAAPTIDRIGMAPQKPATCGFKWHHHPSTTYGCQHGSHGFRRHAHSCQHEACRCFGSKLRQRSTSGDTGYGENLLGKQTFPGKPLLDPRSSGQPKPHKCNLGKQGCGTQGQCNKHQLDGG